MRQIQLALLLSLGITTALSAQTRATLPTGAVFLVRTQQALQSNNAAVGNTFETTVVQDVSVNGYTVIPANSTIRGVVTYVQAATRAQSGVMQVAFNRLTIPNSGSYTITAKLTSTDSTERRQIDARADSRVVLVGERGGLGAMIAGAGSSRSSTSGILGALGAMLSEGLDVNVPAGTQFAVQLEAPLTLTVRGTADLTDESTIYTAADRIRAAQRELARRSYFRGVVNGVLDNATRRALFEFQLDNDISATGNLDGRTASALGILNTAESSGAVLAIRDASILRRAAQALATRQRETLGITIEGRMSTSRALTQADLDVLFAFSAFADNASQYEKFVRGASNTEGSVLAGRALVNSARRVDTTLQGANISASMRNVWDSIRAQLKTIDPTY
jgi:peptidoglycan hydrolase-like protein with peptidoglycan-binding domain